MKNKQDYEKGDGLYRVPGESGDTLVNVVFVHGLGGGGYSTWDSSKEKGSELEFWPESIAKEHTNCSVWTLNYTARALEWKPFVRTRTIDVLERATWLIERLLQHEIHKKPIVFVTHSLGGVLVKQALQFSLSLGPQHWQPIWTRTEGVVFIATPHRGSDLADAAIRIAMAVRGSGILTRLLRRPSPALRNLVKNNPTLTYLSDWYRDQAYDKGIRTIDFTEKRSLPWLGLKVVDEGSANSQVTNTRAKILPDDDHISAAKPRDKDHPVYAGVSKLLHELESQVALAQESAIPGIPLRDKAKIMAQQDNQRQIGRLLGIWWEHVTNLKNETTVSYFTIKRDAVLDTIYIDDGCSYNKQRKLQATWKSVIARISKEQDKIVLHYIWTGTHTLEIKELYHLPFGGFGKMTFNLPGDPKIQVHTGGGEFWDVNESTFETTVKSIELYRVSDDDIRTIDEGKKHKIEEIVADRFNPKYW